MYTSTDLSAYIYIYIYVFVYIHICIYTCVSLPHMCTFRHLKDLEVVPHPRKVPIPSDTLGTWKWSPTSQNVILDE